MAVDHHVPKPCPRNRLDGQTISLGVLNLKQFAESAEDEVVPKLSDARVVWREFVLELHPVANIPNLPDVALDPLAILLQQNFSFFRSLQVRLRNVRIFERNFNLSNPLRALVFLELSVVA